MAKTLPREGWWFSDSSGVLPHGDGRPIVIGKKLSVKGKLVICQNALHGAFDPFDALQYAPGEILHKVVFSGTRIEEYDKVGSRSRTIIASRDATDMLRAYARNEALTVAHLWDMPVIVREYLETGNETKRAAARDAAGGAAGAAARDAAWAAARDAAWDAAWAAAWDAARAVAGAAARDAAGGAAGAAARDAAWDAAWAVAWAVAGAAARQRFNVAVQNLFK